MKYCASPTCENKGRPLSEDCFSIDQSRADGLARICLECNSAKSRAWYEANQLRKQQAALAYKAQHGHSPHLPAVEKRRREQVKQQEQLAAEPDDWQLVRFSQTEWLFCLQEAQELGIAAQEYARILVRDARDLKTRRAYLLEQAEQTNQRTGKGR